MDKGYLSKVKGCVKHRIEPLIVLGCDAHECLWKSAYNRIHRMSEIDDPMVNISFKSDRSLAHK